MCVCVFGIIIILCQNRSIECLNFTRLNFVEKQWTLIYQWAKNIGLDIIVCIAPRYIENESKLHSKNSTNITELLSFSDLMGYNVSWQLGYGKVSENFVFETMTNNIRLKHSI